MENSLKVLPARHGDCFLISHHFHGGTFNLLIDGGPSATFSSAAAGGAEGPLKKALNEIARRGEKINLAILTHIDSDHIGGFLKAYQSKRHLPILAEKIWFNASSSISKFFNHPDIPENSIRCRFDDDPKTSAKQAQTLENYLNQLGVWDQKIIIAQKEEYIEGPFKLTVLSPTADELRKLLCIWPSINNPPNTACTPRDHHISLDELFKNDIFIDDSSIANGSSIAFILDSNGKKILFLGDAFATTIINGLKNIGYSEQNPLKLEFVKVSHHGSRNNTNLELLNLLDCRSFIISTNGSIHRHPDKAVIARILKHNDQNVILFNYETALHTIFSKEEKEQYGHRIKLISDDLAF